MIVDSGQAIRDFSGEYGCPNRDCWLKDFSRVTPLNAICPKCGMELEWPDGVVERYKTNLARRAAKLR